MNPKVGVFLFSLIVAAALSQPNNETLISGEVNDSQDQEIPATELLSPSEEELTAELIAIHDAEEDNVEGESNDDDEDREISYDGVPMTNAVPDDEDSTTPAASSNSSELHESAEQYTTY